MLWLEHSQEADSFSTVRDCLTKSSRRVLPKLRAKRATTTEFLRFELSNTTLTNQIPSRLIGIQVKHDLISRSTRLGSLVLFFNRCLHSKCLQNLLRLSIFEIPDFYPKTVCRLIFHVGEPVISFASLLQVLERKYWKRN